MTTKLHRKRRRIQNFLDNHRFKDLFLEELGWDDYATPLSVTVGDTEYQLA